MKNVANKKRIISVFTAITAILLAAAVVFFDFLKPTEPDSKTGFAMGSEIKIQIWGKTDDIIFDNIFKAINNADTNLLSRNKETSEIYNLNITGKSNVSDELIKIINQSLDISKNTNGAFDITLGKVTSLWNFDGENKNVPEKADIEKLLEYSGTEKIKTDGNTVILGENQALDLGAFGKGYGCDVATEIFKENGVEKAIISVGGTVGTFGSGEFTVGIKTPDANTVEPFLKITISGEKYISTSGNYEKFFTLNGKTYHHILNPQNGFPAESGIKSVTVIAENGALSDALSTACFVLGKKNSKDVLEHYGAEAIFVDNNNKVYITKGIKQSCTLTDSSYTISDYE